MHTSVTGTSVLMSQHDLVKRSPSLRWSRIIAKRPNSSNDSTINSAASTGAPLTVSQSLACGAVARATQIVSMFPVDTVKTRVQVSRRLATSATSATTTALQSVINAISKGALYKGLGFALLGQVPYGMLTFGIYETLKTSFQRSDVNCPDWVKIMLAAVIGDTIGTTVLTPFEVVKSKTQAAVYETPLAAVRAMIPVGPSAFYQGYTAALGRDLPFRAVQLAMYERARVLYARQIKKRPEDLSSMENLLVGAFCGTLTAALTTPLDVLRTRMMSQVAGKGALYTSTMDCFAKTVTQEGIGALFKGVGARCLLIGPSSAVFFLAYEATKTFFRSRARRSSKVAVTPIRGRRGRVLG